MKRRPQLMAGILLIAISLLVLSACSTTSAATLPVPVAASVQDSPASANVPQAIVQAQGVTQTIGLTPPAPLQIQPQEQIQTQEQIPQVGTPVPGTKDLPPAAATPAPGRCCAG